MLGNNYTDWYTLCPKNRWMFLGHSKKQVDVFWDTVYLLSGRTRYKQQRQTQKKMYSWHERLDEAEDHRSSKKNKRQTVVEVVHCVTDPRQMMAQDTNEFIL